jgi:hypothetical protein
MQFSVDWQLSFCVLTKKDDQSPGFVNTETRKGRDFSLAPALRDSCDLGSSLMDSLLKPAKRKMPRCARGIFEVGFELANSGPAKDAAENTASTVATVSITAVLSIALRVALFEAAAKGLRRSVPPIV